VTALALAALATATPSAAELSPKIDPALVRAMTDAADGKVEMLVVLADQADLSAARDIHGKEAKGRFVYETLTAHAARTQAPIVAELDRAKATHRSFWVANFLVTEGNLALADSLAARADVTAIVANPPMGVVQPAVDDAAPAQIDTPFSPLGVEWNIVKVNADDVWTLGYTGQGAVVGGQDTGYDWDHPALRDMYRGWNGASADHDYNWHDAIHSDIVPTGDGSSCGYNAATPCDDNDHGTHTMGTMIGDDGGTNQIGLAPGARWIGCRNMDAGWGNPTTYSECFQWFIAPTTVAGGSPNPALAPDVINNSWGCPLSGYPSGYECIGQSANVLQTVTENVRAAGIVVVVSAGNEGSGCSTVASPISGFSSRGPVTVDGSNRMKPDISAPGSNVRSSVPPNQYASFSGTSMAGPHVAGLVALLISAKPELAGEVDTIEQIIRDTAFEPSFAGACGIAAGVFPNNTFGAGRIDALAAVQLALSGLPFLADFEGNDLDEWSAAAP